MRVRAAANSAFTIRSSIVRDSSNHSRFWRSTSSCGSSHVPMRIRSSCTPQSAAQAPMWKSTSFTDQPSGVRPGPLHLLVGQALELDAQFVPRRLLGVEQRLRVDRHRSSLCARVSGRNSKALSAIRTSSPRRAPAAAS